MATQPLKTIPEETTAPAPQVTTPARVTADPPKTKPATEKNPGRVASGKRLAERNRLARAAKKQAEAAKPASTNATPAQPSDTTPTPPTDQSSNSTFLILGVCGLLVSAAGVYYQREAIVKRPKPAPPAPAPAPEPVAPAPSHIPVKKGIRQME